MGSSLYSLYASKSEILLLRICSSFPRKRLREMDAPGVRSWRCTQSAWPQEPHRLFSTRVDFVANEEMLQRKATNENNLVQHLRFMHEEAEGQRGERGNNYNLLRVLDLKNQHNLWDVILVPCHCSEVTRSSSTLQTRRLSPWETQVSL